MTQKPSERILAIINAMKKSDGKRSSATFHTYEAGAIAQYLDELVKSLHEKIDPEI